uniref:Uncharacterized protein n=2 Tax=Anguilla anguilla TaxID=7936 RepID=A0A0E9VQ33_ANGAN
MNMLYLSYSKEKNMNTTGHVFLPSCRTVSKWKMRSGSCLLE